jgi:hypothetical protein
MRSSDGFGYSQLMQELVHRQQELRLRIINAAYAAFIQDADGFIDAFEIDPGVGPAHPLEDVAERVDLKLKPPTKAEVRGAAYYLVERGMLVMMSNETLEKHGLKVGDVYIHITGDGIDMFEGLVLSSESRAATRPVGFQPGPREPLEARPHRSINPWTRAGFDQELEDSQES